MKGLVEVQKKIVLRQFVQGSAAKVDLDTRSFIQRSILHRTACNFKKWISRTKVEWV